MHQRRINLADQAAPKSWTPFPSMESIARWLRLSVSWPNGVSLVNVRIHRLWAGKKRRVTFELELVLSRNGTSESSVLQGGISEHPPVWRPRHRADMGANGIILGLRLFDAELGIWVCSPDRDKRLPIIRDLLDRAELGRLLDCIIPEQKSSERIDGQVERRQIREAGLSSDLIAYRTNRRCVFRVIDQRSGVNDKTIFVKAFKRPPKASDIAATREFCNELAQVSHGFVRVPDILGYDEVRGVLVTAGIQDQESDQSKTHDDIERAAKCLAALHQCGAEAHSRVHSALDEVDTVARWADVLPIVLDARAHQLEEIVLALKNRAEELHPSINVSIHRDFYDAQLIHHKNVSWILDLDTLCAGHAELDIATYTAHCFFDALRSGDAHQDTKGTMELLITKYQLAGGDLSRKTLQFYMSCALARLGALQFARGASKAIVKELWNFAEDYLEGRAVV